MLYKIITEWKKNFFHTSDIVEEMEKNNWIQYDQPDECWIAIDPLGNEYKFKDKFLLDRFLGSVDIYTMDSPFRSHEYKIKKEK
jgi:hypothetical protein